MTLEQEIEALGWDLDHLDEVQVRMIYIAAVQDISINEACRVMLSEQRDLESRAKEFCLDLPSFDDIFTEYLRQ